jgi:hypothetical protein
MAKTIHTDTLASNPDSPVSLVPEPPRKKRKYTRRKATNEPRAKRTTKPAAPKLTEEQLAALGRLTVEAAKAGLELDAYAEATLVPMAEAYAAWCAVRSTKS